MTVTLEFVVINLKDFEMINPDLGPWVRVQEQLSCRFSLLLLGADSTEPPRVPARARAVRAAAPLAARLRCSRRTGPGKDQSQASSCEEEERSL